MDKNSTLTISLSIHTQRKIIIINDFIVHTEIYRITYIELIRQGVLKAEDNKYQQLGGYREIN